MDGNERVEICFACVLSSTTFCKHFLFAFFRSSIFAVLFYFTSSCSNMILLKKKITKEKLYSIFRILAWKDLNSLLWFCFYLFFVLVMNDMKSKFNIFSPFCSIEWIIANDRQKKLKEQTSEMRRNVVIIIKTNFIPISLEQNKNIYSTKPKTHYAAIVSFI